MTLFKYVLVLLLTAACSMLTAKLGGESTVEGILQLAAATGVIAGLAKAQQLITEHWANRWPARAVSWL
jgi:hypothetical protein